MGGLVSSIFGGGDAGDASIEAAALQAGAQREALQYLKEREEIPQQFREGALGVIGGLYGLQGGAENAVDTLRQSPMYQAILGTRAAGEEAILRNAAATGGLRSGNVQDALARYSAELEQQALGSSLSGLSGLANLPSNVNQIAAQTSAIGQTLGQGQVAAAQAEQAQQGQMMNMALNAASMFFSDRRLKENVKLIGSENGFSIYSWSWNEEAMRALGLSGSASGVMADEVEKVMPAAVVEREGYKTVDYNAIGVKHG